MRLILRQENVRVRRGGPGRAPDLLHVATGTCGKAEAGKGPKKQESADIAMA
jgi:hypothetical protein